MPTISLSPNPHPPQRPVGEPKGAEDVVDVGVRHVVGEAEGEGGEVGCVFCKEGDTVGCELVNMKREGFDGE